MEGLAPIDHWVALAVIAKAAGYGAALLAMGGPLFAVAFPRASVDVLGLAQRVAVIAALAALVVLALRFGIRAARISGMGLSGALDPVMLGFVWESPLGTAALWQAGGALMIIAWLMRGRVGLGIALLGTLLIGLSFTFVGHSLGDPPALLAGLLTAHLLAAAFWVAALPPLFRAVQDTGGAALLHRFGHIAAVTVSVLVAAGLVFAWLMTGSLVGLFTTAYGWTLLAKLALVAGLMALAALNKWRLVPALATGMPRAGIRLRRSILVEAIAVALILLATAALTSVTTPPVNL
ncbi:putative copper resistance protein D [Roseovarius nanhaiticus]|uniref:Putative copper resistance protein D n=1 Tax=Roseovarius nanhaiticus TaxID=573024 RepID=A0A1N7HBI1_9RHOB|nr:CopD family protein [Roseovarius nanhaiticus]SEL04368.1 putative copper resistance protein D [Roseovarius nanhaiticus]SIS22226.1 putative copper resistance protein D [Roseovarius nanhaiticus]